MPGYLNKFLRCCAVSSKYASGFGAEVMWSRWSTQ